MIGLLLREEEGRGGDRRQGWERERKGEGKGHTGISFPPLRAMHIVITQRYRAQYDHCPSTSAENNQQSNAAADMCKCTVTVCLWRLLNAIYSVSQKVTPLKRLALASANLHRVAHNYVHKPWCIWSTVTKFWKNPLYHLADFLYLQNVVKKFSYHQHYLLVSCVHWPFSA